MTTTREDEMPGDALGIGIGEEGIGTGTGGLGTADGHSESGLGGPGTVETAQPGTGGLGHEDDGQQMLEARPEKNRVGGQRGD